MKKLDNLITAIILVCLIGFMVGLGVCSPAQPVSDAQYGFFLNQSLPVSGGEHV